MPDMAYHTDGLRTGAGELAASATAADRARAVLRTSRSTAAMFGRTPGSVVFAAVVAAAREAQCRGLGTEADRATDLSARAEAGAALGDALTAETTTIAGSVSTPRP